MVSNESVGFNGLLAVLVTRSVGSMWCAYAFAALTLISLPEAIHQGTFALISWISQTFLQLVLLSVIMVGQQVLAKASDKQALQTFQDTEAVLRLTDEIHSLVKVNNGLTDEIHRVVSLGTDQVVNEIHCTRSLVKTTHRGQRADDIVDF
ncbi:hypothetical protein [Paraburkholderia silvatlantica]|uniref:Low affinity Fe/Cu permease n=1 Tax=Paraburkholderia silvatlantica TaxID=321895 RepID=A0ABR6FTN8_9BURK|nr:hypothetical protein [Paraburkholderia silvatlantica]MBB2930790.1 hypothetical protein [Paraburkholderia silvatlantica]PVY31943.1 hypothetical protein C7411_111135 [Paraburkholderia silvatlantica]PXW37514.1 hypothetical protein C7413_111135 [Paraburkholderia silvatlantica]